MPSVAPADCNRGDTAPTMDVVSIPGWWRFYTRKWVLRLDYGGLGLIW